MKKIAIVSVIILFLCAIFSMSQFSHTAVAANVYETDSQIRVFIGTTENMNANQEREYNEIQQDLLNQLSFNSSNEIGAALVTFTRFLSEEEANMLLSGVNNINTVYIWTPNKEGRAIIDVEDNDISATIMNYFSSLDIDNAANPDYKSDMQELISNYGIFAVEVKAEYSLLESMSTHTDMRIDLIQSPSAIALASETSKPVTYICIPEKPDGTA